MTQSTYITKYSCRFTSASYTLCPGKGLFTNNIPDLAHQYPVTHQAPANYCRECGSSVCYVDDCTFSHGDSDPVSMSVTLTAQYKTISDYMVANRLVINAEKTNLIVMGTRATAKRRYEVSLQAGQHVIVQTRTEKLLGGHVCEDLKWNEHLLGSDQSLVKQLTSRVNGLLMVAARAPFLSRLSVANGIFMSKLCYLIQLWGGAGGYLLHAL